MPRERREEWTVQIRETVDHLHEIGAVWGDGKAGNFIIDNNDIALADWFRERLDGGTGGCGVGRCRGRG